MDAPQWVVDTQAAAAVGGVTLDFVMSGVPLPSINQFSLRCPPNLSTQLPARMHACMHDVIDLQCEYLVICLHERGCQQSLYSRVDSPVRP